MSVEEPDLMLTCGPPRAETASFVIASIRLPLVAIRGRKATRGLAPISAHDPGRTAQDRAGNGCLLPSRHRPRPSRARVQPPFPTQSFGRINRAIGWKWWQSPCGAGTNFRFRSVLSCFGLERKLVPVPFGSGMTTSGMALARAGRFTLEQANCQKHAYNDSHVQQIQANGIVRQRHFAANGGGNDGSRHQPAFPGQG